MRVATGSCKWCPHVLWDHTLNLKGLCANTRWLVSQLNYTASSSCSESWRWLTGRDQKRTFVLEALWINNSVRHHIVGRIGIVIPERKEISEMNLIIPLDFQTQYRRRNPKRQYSWDYEADITGLKESKVLERMKIHRQKAPEICNRSMGLLLNTELHECSE